MKKLKYEILIVGIILISGYLYISLTPPVSPFEVVSYKKDTLQFEVQYSRPFKKDRIILEILKSSLSSASKNNFFTISNFL